MASTGKRHMKNDLVNARSAYIAILLLGIVSLMGDVVYEGSRGLVPDYLTFLGASAFIVVFVGRFGEFLGYALRLVSGALADTTKAYWVFIFLGYGLIVAIPLLGFTSLWWIAIMLILFERIGKAVRSPSRDAVLSIVSKGVGAGKAFGIHELLDQTGAILGPLIVAALMFYSGNSYSQTFSFLLLPFLVLLAVLFYTYGKVGRKKPVDKPEKDGEKSGKLERAFYIYTAAVFLNTVGLIPYELILVKASTILQPANQQWIVPLIYMLIQGVDAPTALFAGYSYDKFKIKVLTLPFLLSVAPTLFAMVNADLTMLIVAAVFFGLVLGMQESIYRAAVSEFAPISSRGTAYGIFNTAYGVGMLASGFIYGLIAALSPLYLFIVLYVLATQFAAVILLLKAYSKTTIKLENVKA
ncbi:MAG: MFS transporter [Candidatus Bathyarchaeales archaeon]